MSESGQNPNLPHRNTDARFTSINGHKGPLVDLLDAGESEHYRERAANWSTICPVVHDRRFALFYHASAGWLLRAVFHPPWEPPVVAQD